MYYIIEKLNKKIIVSCQASQVEPMYESVCMAAMIKSVIKGGACGLRLAGERDIKQAKIFSDIPVIGITKPDPLPKNWKNVVYITPTYNDAKIISEAGADIIAIDGTSRPRPLETLSELILKIKNNLNKPVMADISTFEEGINCTELGANIISTTLSGYTAESLEKNNGEPDFELLKRLTTSLSCPVILEGRVWTPEHVIKAFELGAYAVVIGSAITRPELITRRFVDSTLK